jgi:predicted nucleic acid-binding protein
MIVVDASMAVEVLLATRAGSRLRYSHRPLLSRMWELRTNLTAYDPAYVALAEALDAPLITRDARLARAPHRARVEVV